MNRTPHTAISRILRVVLIAIISSMPYAVIGQNIKISGAGTPQLDKVFADWTTIVYSMRATELNYNSSPDLSTLDNLLNRKIDFLIIRDSKTPLELDSETFFQFPLLLSAVVPVVNLPPVMVPELTLDGMVLGNIIVGNISRWNDPMIWIHDPGNLLQDLPITIVRQNPKSDVTEMLIEYLELNSPDWTIKHAEGSAPGLPRGLEADSEENAVMKLKRIAGSIGYVSYSAFSKNTLTPITLMDLSGSFATPSEQSIRNTADRSGWSIGSSFYPPIGTGSAENTWPMVVEYRAVILREYPDRNKGHDLVAFFDWCFDEQKGKSEGSDNMVALPAAVVKMIQAEWTTSISCNGVPVWP